MINLQDVIDALKVYWPTIEFKDIDFEMIIPSDYFKGSDVNGYASSFDLYQHKGNVEVVMYEDRDKGNFKGTNQ